MLDVYVCFTVAFAADQSRLVRHYLILHVKHWQTKMIVKIDLTRYFVRTKLEDEKLKEWLEKQQLQQFEPVLREMKWNPMSTFGVRKGIE